MIWGGGIRHLFDQADKTGNPVLGISQFVRDDPKKERSGVQE
ncbi:MAG: hypothetical protein JW384_01002 [Nitrosomonadaceae bacterium]|nr:hypothetical protein [Nitrosomonadaceae bacterium]